MPIETRNLESPARVLPYLTRKDGSGRVFLGREVTDTLPGSGNRPLVLGRGERVERSGELPGEGQNSATGQASSFPHAAARMLPLVIIGLGLNNRVSSEGLLMTAMTKPSLTIPVYDRALHALKSSIVAGMISVDPMLGQIASRTTGHAGPVRNVPGPNPVDHDWTQFQGDYALHIYAIRETDVDAFITAIYGVAEQYAEAIGATLLRTANPETW